MGKVIFDEPNIRWVNYIVSPKLVKLTTTHKLTEFNVKHIKFTDSPELPNEDSGPWKLRGENSLKNFIIGLSSPQRLFVKRPLKLRRIKKTGKKREGKKVQFFSQKASAKERDYR